MQRLEALPWITAQVWLFSAAFLLGMLLGVCSLLYARHSLRRRGQPKGSRWLADSLFVLWQTAMAAALWLLGTDGSLHSSDFLWMCGGFLLSRRLFAGLCSFKQKKAKPGPAKKQPDTQRKNPAGPKKERRALPSHWAEAGAYALLRRYAVGREALRKRFSTKKKEEAEDEEEKI